VFEIVERKINGSNILQAKRNIAISECTPRTDKSCFMLVLGFDMYLIISRETIHEKKDLTACAFIDNLVDK
jgi:hypothetical protein